MQEGDGYGLAAAWLAGSSTAVRVSSAWGLPGVCGAEPGLHRGAASWCALRYKYGAQQAQRLLSVS